MLGTSEPFLENNTIGNGNEKTVFDAGGNL